MSLVNKSKYASLTKSLHKKFGILLRIRGKRLSVGKFPLFVRNQYKILVCNKLLIVILYNPRRISVKQTGIIGMYRYVFITTKNLATPKPSTAWGLYCSLSNVGVCRQYMKNI